MSAPQILVVEDHPDAREMLVEWLDAVGFSPEGDTNGLEALERLKGGARPVLILLDLMMPRMDGWTFMKEARAAGLLEGVAVWVVSAAEHIAPPEGITGFLPKPVDLDKLRQIVERYRA